MPNRLKKGPSNLLLLKIFYRRHCGLQIIDGNFDVNMKKITRMVHIIIDGYNMIRQIPTLSEHERVSLESGRKNLLALLARYKRLKHHPVTVVFDGASTMSEFAPAGKEMGIGVRYSPENSSADEVIARLAQK
jgi:predicted RNA-binding protein with PIN domain